MLNNKKIIALILCAIMIVSTLGIFGACSDRVDIPEEETTAYGMDTLGRDIFPVLLYIGPTPEYYSSYDNVMVPNFIRDDVFQNLVESGINVICGHNETEEEMVQMLNYCAKYNMTYLPRCDLYGFARWDNDTNKIITWEDYSEVEKQKVENDFRDYLRKWSAYDAFGGICTGDEDGILVAPAFKRMKEIFDEECPGKLMYENMFGPEADGTMWCDYNPFANEATSAGLTHQLENTWDDVMYKYADYVGLDVMSFDNYLFYSNNMATKLFLDIDKFRRAMGNSEKPIWYFVQDGQENTLRNQSYEESYYQMNAPLAVGVSGLCLYPGFSPIEMATSPQFSIYDRKTGKPTYYMDWYKEIFGQIHACEKVLMNAAYKGTMVSNGNGYSEVIVKNKLDNFYRLSDVRSTYSQIVVGCYTWKGHEVLWLFNNAISNQKKAQPNLTFTTKVDAVVVKNGQIKSYKNKENLRVFLNPGEGAMVVLGTDTLDVA